MAGGLWGSAGAVIAEEIEMIINPGWRDNIDKDKDCYFDLLVPHFEAVNGKFYI
jgi:hypothetical protein